MFRLFRTAVTEPTARIASPAAASNEAPVERIEAPAAPAPGPSLDLLEQQARVSAAASEAGVSIGWITHDSAQVAEQARLIAAASEEVAASTSEIAARSAGSADTAERARAGIAECALDMRQARERMQVIEGCTAEIGDRLDGKPKQQVDVTVQDAQPPGPNADTLSQRLTSQLASRAGFVGSSDTVQ